MAKNREENSTTVSTDPTVMAEQQKLTRLQIKLTELKGELSGVVSIDHKNAAETAEAILKGEPFATANQSIAALRQEISLFEQAIYMQQRAISDAERKASERIAESMRPGYIDATKEVLAAAVKLQDALVKQEQYRQKVNAAGISASMHGMPSHAVGFGADLCLTPNGKLGFFIQALRTTTK